MEGAVVSGGDDVDVSGGQAVEMGAAEVEGKVVEMGAAEVEGANTNCANVVQSKALSNASF